MQYFNYWQQKMRKLQKVDYKLQEATISKTGMMLFY